MSLGQQIVTDLSSFALKPELHYNNSHIILGRDITIENLVQATFLKTYSLITKIQLRNTSLSCLKTIKVAN